MDIRLKHNTYYVRIYTKKEFSQETMLRMTAIFSERREFLEWQFNDDTPIDPEEGLTISFQFMFISEKRWAMRWFKEVLSEMKIDWLVLNNRKWSIKLDDLHDSFQELQELEWLKGEVLVTPEIEISRNSSLAVAYVKFILIKEEVVLSYPKKKIFISHANEDLEFAKKLELDLKSHMLNVWIDNSNTFGGDNITIEINKALKWCDTLLLIWSKAAEHSDWVQREWASAYHIKKRIIPCTMGYKEMPPLLAAFKFIDFQEYDLALYELLRALGEQELKEASIIFEENLDSTSVYDPVLNDVNEILKLFYLRDEAVLEKDNSKFLSTQLNNKEINGAHTKGYLRCSKMNTSVANIFVNRQNQKFDNGYSVVVKEDYEHDNRFTHSGYIIYYVTKIETGLKIKNFRIA